MRLSISVLFGILLSLLLIFSSARASTPSEMELVAYNRRPLSAESALHHPTKVARRSSAMVFSRINIYKEFPIVIVVNKSPRGMFAQTAQLWENGQRTAQFAISTGREQWEKPPSGEKYFSETPSGWYSQTWQDPHYISRTWQT